MKRRLMRHLCALGAAWLLAAAPSLSPAGAQEMTTDWRSEFEAVCVKTDLAMTLSSEELAELVIRCDRLAERIGAEAEIVRKVFLKRLQSCRALFVYVLDTRGAASTGASAPAPPPQGQASAPPVSGESAAVPEVTPSP